MRPDMHKVVIERPRHGRSWAESRPRPKPPFEDSPRFESIKARYTRRKWFSDLLGPLKRWLQSQVGRPWNEAYSEACKVIKPDSPIRAHVKTHLLAFVERNTFMHEGKVCVLDTGYLGKPVPVSANCRYRSLFFVHPDTGLLLPSPRLSKRACALAIRNRRLLSTGFAKASGCNKSEAFGLSVVLKLCRWTSGSGPTTRAGESGQSR